MSAVTGDRGERLGCGGRRAADQVKGNGAAKGKGNKATNRRLKGTAIAHQQQRTWNQQRDEAATAAAGAATSAVEFIAAAPPPATKGQAKSKSTNWPFNLKKNSRSVESASEHDHKGRRSRCELNDQGQCQRTSKAERPDPHAMMSEDDRRLWLRVNLLIIRLSGGQLWLVDWNAATGARGDCSHQGSISAAHWNVMR